jgi:hypothetical protein
MSKKISRRLLKNRCSQRTDICHHLLVATHSLTHISHTTPHLVNARLVKFSGDYELNTA